MGLLAGQIYALASSGFGLPYVTKHLVPLVTQPDKPESGLLFGYLALVPIMFALRALGSFVNAYFIAYSGMQRPGANTQDGVRPYSRPAPRLLPQKIKWAI